MKHFAGLKNPVNERTRTYATATARKAPEAMVVTDKEATNTVLIMAFPYTKKHEEVTMSDYRKNIVSEMAQQLINRRLMDQAQSSNPPFPYAGVSMDELIHGYESFSVFALVGADGPGKVINAVTAELLKANKYGFSDDELELVRKEMLSNIEKTYNEKTTTDSKNYVEEYIRAFLNGEAFPGIDNEYAYQKSMLPGITAADVNEQIKKWMSNPNTFTLITAPDKSDVKLPSDKELLVMTGKGFKQEITKTTEEKIATSLMTTTPAPGKVVSQQKEEGFDATTYTLSNGIKVTIKPTDFKSDEILMSGIKQGGSNSYGIADRSNVKFATDIMDNMGYGAYNPTEIEKILAGKKIEANMVISDINDEVNCSSTINDFESMLQLTYLQIMQPRKDEALFEAYKGKQTAMLQFMSSNPQASFIDTAVKTMYGNNPLARMVIPTPADFDKINLDRAIQIYSDEFGSADGYHFFIVGNIKPETAIPLIETYLGSIPAKNKTVAYKDNGVRPIKGKNELKFHKGSEKKSMILGVYTGEISYSEDLALKTKAVAEILNIKVIQDLREKLGAIYTGGFNGNVSKEPYERYSIQLQLPCGPENVDKLIAAANDEIKSLKEKGPEAIDLDKVKSQWIEKYKTDVKENKYWKDKMESALFWGRDKDRILQYESYINKLTPADIQATAQKLFTGDNEFLAILYPES